jgi:hypothetical protein
MPRSANRRGGWGRLASRRLAAGDQPGQHPRSVLLREHWLYSKGDAEKLLRAGIGSLGDFAQDALGQRHAFQTQVAIRARPAAKSARALTECVNSGPRAGTLGQFSSGRKIRQTPSERGVSSPTPTLVKPPVWTLLIAGKEDPAEMPAGYTRQTGNRMPKSRKMRFRQLSRRAWFSDSESGGPALASSVVFPPHPHIPLLDKPAVAPGVQSPSRTDRFGRSKLQAWFGKARASPWHPAVGPAQPSYSSRSA